MKRLTTLSLIALAAAAMIAVPLDAQTRSGSNSRGGSGSGRSGGSAGSRPSSSMSAPSSQVRGSGSAGNTKGLGSTASRSSQGSTPSTSQSRSYSSQQPARQASGQTGTASRSSVGSASQTPPRSSQPARTGSNTRSSTTVRQSTPSGSSTPGSSTSGSTTVRGSQPRATGAVQPQSRQGRTVNRNQPQPGMSAHPDAPRTVRQSPGTPRNFDGGRGPSHVQMHPGPGHNMERIPPRHRDPMPYGRAVRFWDGGMHYFGYRVSYLPPRYVREVYWGVPYYMLDGIYYRHYNGYYYVSRPPFGVFFDPVLDDLVYSICRFSYYNNVYNTYRTIDENAQIIASQNATIAANNATIAQQNADIALNTERAARAYKEADRLGLVQSYADAGMEYFYQDGVFFIKNSDGKYVTIVPPAGALVQELPDDYETITLDGKEYYKVDDTVYQLTIVDGSPYFEVLGQMTGALAAKYNQYDTL